MEVYRQSSSHSPGWRHRVIHAGSYPESIVPKNHGATDKPIIFRAFAMTKRCSMGPMHPAERWQLITNSRNIYSLAIERDPGQSSWMVKYSTQKWTPSRASIFRTYKRGILTDADRNMYQYEPKSKRLLLNLGGETPARHVVLVPVRQTAFALGANCQLAGVHITHYVGTSISVSGDDSLVEDCLVTDSGHGIGVVGWNCRGVIIRRNTIIGALGNGIFLSDRPTQCVVEDNLALRCTLNPANEDCWVGSFKLNSASDTVFAHNVALEAGNPGTDGGHDGWGFWGDINVGRVMYVGNTCANNKYSGLYVEFGMDDTRAYFNTFIAMAVD